MLRRVRFRQFRYDVKFLVILGGAAVERKHDLRTRLCFAVNIES
jgi:hypothetical protein